MNVCSKCSGELADGAAVCAFCGEPAEATSDGFGEQDSLSDPPLGPLNEPPFQIVELESMDDSDGEPADDTPGDSVDEIDVHASTAPPASGPGYDDMLAPHTIEPAASMETHVPEHPRAAVPDVAAAAGSRPFTLQEIGAVLVAAAVGGIVVLWMLRSFAPPSTHAAASTPAAGRASKTAAAAASGRTTRSWTRADADWVDPKRGIALQVLANERVKVWQRYAQPILVVRCIAKRTDAFVFIESPAKIEPQPWRTVHVGWDGGAEEAERWTDSTDHDALFSPDAAAFAIRLQQAQTLTFGYTPHNADPVVAHFEVTGLAQQLAPFARQCGGR